MTLTNSEYYCEIRQHLPIVAAINSQIDGEAMFAEGLSLDIADIDSTNQKGNQVTIVVGFDAHCHFNIIHLGTAKNAQNTVNAAIAALPSQGGRILLRKGVYNITDSVVVNKSNVTIEGEGSTTVLKRLANFGDGVVCLTADRCKLKNLFVDGNKKICTDVANRGIFVGANSCLVEGVQCVDNGFQGIYLRKSSKSLIVNSTFSSNAYGICCFDCNNQAITNNVCNQNTDGGIVFSYSMSSLVADNTCNSNHCDGIYIDCHSKNNKVCQNDFEANKGVAINVKGKSNVVEGNRGGN